jgi:hypothetical protein
MKSLLVLLAVAASVSLLALAQSGTESASPSPASASSTPGAAPSAAAPAVPGGNPGEAASSVPLPGQSPGPALEKNLPLIPETAPSGSGKPRKSRGSGEAGPNASVAPKDTFGVEQDVRVRIHMREAETLAANDPKIQADWVAAHNTLGDPARRAALIAYYNHLFDRMIKIDPTIADRVNARREAVVARMHYTRLGDLVPDDNPYATPAPAAEGKNPPNDEGSLLP